MNNVFDPTTVAGLTSRINSLTPATIPQWGNPRETARLDPARDQARLVLGEGQFAATLAAGRSLSSELAAAEALALAAALPTGAG